MVAHLCHAQKCNLFITVLSCKKETFCSYSQCRVTSTTSNRAYFIIQKWKFMFNFLRKRANDKREREKKKRSDSHFLVSCGKIHKLLNSIDIQTCILMNSNGITFERREIIQVIY